MVNPCKNKLLALHLQSISFGEKRIATLAQLVEQRIRNAQVEGSNPLSGSKKIRRKIFRLVFLLCMRKKHIDKDLRRIFEDRFLLEEGVCWTHSTDEKRNIDRKDPQRCSLYYP